MRHNFPGTFLMQKRSLSHIRSWRARERRNVTKLWYPRKIVQRSRNEDKISTTPRHRTDSHNRGGAIATREMHRFSRQCAQRPRPFPVFFGEKRDGTECLAATPFGGLPPGNGAVAHRACVTLLRAYNHPGVSLSPPPWLGLFSPCPMARIFSSRSHSERSSSTFRSVAYPK